jgi:hypothetical protein
MSARKKRRLRIALVRVGLRIQWWSEVGGHEQQKITQRGGAELR